MRFNQSEEKTEVVKEVAISVALTKSEEAKIKRMVGVPQATPISKAIQMLVKSIGKGRMYLNN